MMMNRTRMASDYEFSSAVRRFCEGHGSRDHQPIKGMLETGLSRSEYVRKDLTRLAREIVRDFLGGFHSSIPGKRAAGASKRGQRDVFFLGDEDHESDDQEDLEPEACEDEELEMVLATT